MNARSAWFGVMAAVAVAITLFLGLRGEEDPDPTRAAQAPPPAVGAAGPGAEAGLPSALAEAPGQAAPGSTVWRDALPGSLRGTDIDGGLAVDADGHFLPTPDALALFDYYLSASGEEPLPVLRARILAYIDAHLAAPADAEARALLDDYLGLRERLRALAASGDVPGDLERRLQWIRELRREAFGAATAEALYGDAESSLRIDLERRRVALDPGLDPAEREAELAALDAQLPEAVREARRRARAPAELYREAEDLRASGADEAEIFALREARYDAATAERLAALDAARAAWQARLDAYRAERDALLERSRDLGAADRESALDALRRAHFDEAEARRVRALDQG